MQNSIYVHNLYSPQIASSKMNTAISTSLLKLDEVLNEKAHKIMLQNHQLPPDLSNILPHYEQPYSQKDSTQTQNLGNKYFKQGNRRLIKWNKKEPIVFSLY